MPRRRTRLLTSPIFAVAVCFLVVILGFVFLRGSHHKTRHTQAADSDAPRYPVVLLLSQPRPLDRAAVEKAAGRAFGVDFASDDPNRAEFVSGDGQTFLVHLKSADLAIERGSGSYFQLDPKSATPENSGGWIAVEISPVESGPKIPEKQAWQLVANLAAQFVADDCRALFIPQYKVPLPLTPRLAAQLKSADPFAGIANVAATSDLPLEDAVAEAHRRWPEFVAAFPNRQAGQLFTARVVLAEPDKSEEVWIEVNSIDGDDIQGIIRTQPQLLKTFKIGDMVHARAADITDWTFDQGDSTVGDFTAEALRQQR